MSSLPSVFLNHGGGPLPLLGRQPHVTNSLLKLRSLFPSPSAILIISAHFSSPVPTFLSHPSPPLLFDYYGFPPPSYSFKYPAQTSQSLTQRAFSILSHAGLNPAYDADRGYDHGIFVPLKIMFPEADVPLVVLSLPEDMDASKLWKMGEALGDLRKEGVAIIGSGASFHNFDAFFRREEDRDAREKDEKKARLWDDWLRESVQLGGDEGKLRLMQWRETGTEATFAHPTQEHLAPLIVVAAAGGGKGKPVEEEGTGRFKTSQFVFE